MSENQFYGRTLARSQALQLLFQAEATGRSVEDVLAGDYALSQGPLDDYARELALGTDSMRPVLDAIISSASTNWAIGRMPSVDRNLLRIALYEMLYEDDVAVAVTIDEMVELAKAYGTDESSRFVNGLLGRVADDLEAGTDVVSEAQERVEEQRVQMADEVASEYPEDEVEPDDCSDDESDWYSFDDDPAYREADYDEASYDEASYDEDGYDEPRYGDRRYDDRDPYDDSPYRRSYRDRG